ncbi:MULTISPECIES: PA3496 family putative envelope integrity protein [Pseudomonas]|jgi:hypothetical protein|uniref:PA3496 family putative envelope integrity protein n=1 Tax=Pseudomonas TaxID=286 RepID=UPI0002889A68|nr:MULTISPECIES: hypothetical protein [Pseudomonas]AMB78487.1 hypothetical protein AV641_05100 [Pseudomonas fragi]MCB1652833.1 hypothetical protein [Pseudomonadales bacterium]NBF14431.1 hypothetical protein [Pseudomonas sp. Fl4BN2]NNG60409.1 hypothetical protein [Pseudomonas sp. GC01]AUB74198.1 hypothetical protein B195_004940 [Pseudomonas sp. Lz4W]
MSTGKEQLEVEEDFPVSDPEEIVEPVVEVAKTNLAKRRTIDALLAEKRLKKELEDYPYDL